VARDGDGAGFREIGPLARWNLLERCGAASTGSEGDEDGWAIASAGDRVENEWVRSIRGLRRVLIGRDEVGFAEFGVRAIHLLVASSFESPIVTPR
jgi:hypothetical protein